MRSHQTRRGVEDGSRKWFEVDSNIIVSLVVDCCEGTVLAAPQTKTMGQLHSSTYAVKVLRGSAVRTQVILADLSVCRVISSDDPVVELLTRSLSCYANIAFDDRLFVLIEELETSRMLGTVIDSSKNKIAVVRNVFQQVEYRFACAKILRTRSMQL